jgi:hypothetical protein
MPFIGGRYHINPIMGEALEAAREAEAALLALEQEAQQNRHGECRELSDPAPAGRKGPIRRIEIDTAEMVPAHLGRGARAYVARVHRQPAPDAAAPDEDSTWRDAGDGTFSSQNSTPLQPETHAFSDHRDLVNFLHDELTRNDER